MNVSNRQVVNVVKMYTNNMKGRAPSHRKEDSTVEYFVSISEEGIKRMLFERIEESVVKRSMSHGQD
jgi:hypothetical protein